MDRIGREDSAFVNKAALSKWIEPERTLHWLTRPQRGLRTGKQG